MKTAILLASAVALSLSGGPALAGWDFGSSRGDDKSSSSWGSGGKHGSYGNGDAEDDKYGGYTKKKFGKIHEPKEEPPEEPEAEPEPEPEPEAETVERVRFNNNSSGGCSTTDFIRSSGKDCNEDSNDQ